MMPLGRFRTCPESWETFCACYQSAIRAQAEEITGNPQAAEALTRKILRTLRAKYADTLCPPGIHLAVLSEVCLAFARTGAVHDAAIPTPPIHVETLPPPELPPPEHVPELPPPNPPNPPNPPPDDPPADAPSPSAPPAPPDAPSPVYDPAMTAVWQPTLPKTAPPPWTASAELPPEEPPEPIPRRSMIHTVINTVLFLCMLGAGVWLLIKAGLLQWLM